MNPLTSRRATRWCRLLLAGGFLLLPICSGGELFKEFRLGAGPGIESGVLSLLEGDAAGLESIVDSFIMGLFDVWLPN